jgi:Fe-S oxidoreductase
MSLAFGWFLLIVVGKLETLYYTHDVANEIYYPVFFRFFEQTPHESMILHLFNELMDFLLFFILTGLMIAIAKRFYSRLTGLKKITKHSSSDKLALSLLWFIFPLRLLAESTTASYTGNGSFLTQPFGDFLATFMPAKQVSIVFWWLYSTVLGTFLITIPFSRYMHIPTEIILIFLRNYGIKTGDHYSGYSEFELQSCSRCGICIDTCQMNGQKKSGSAQMVYFLRDLRSGMLNPELSDNCMMCGKCNDVCPVGIDLTRQRLIQRKNHSNNFSFDFSSLEETDLLGHKSNEVDIVYFAGCMSHLSPGIIQSMIKIFKAANLNYFFMDQKGSICCGRPLKLSGQFEAAGKLMESNKNLILSSGAKTLITSCPICYKSFKEDYHLDIRIQHHSEFLFEIIRKKKLSFITDQPKIVYHDPCELGRGSGIYEQPRMLLERFSHLVPLKSEKEKALCCGGSLGNLSIPVDEREKIQKATAGILNSQESDYIATSCPMCKKSIAQFSTKPVKDIAELVSANLESGKITVKVKMHEDKIPELIQI